MDPRAAKRILARTKRKLRMWSALDRNWRARRIYNLTYELPHVVAALLNVSSKRSSRTPGIDRVTRDCVERAGSDRFVEQVRERQKAGWFFSPLRIIDIPKESGGTRTIGIGTYADRVAEVSFVQILDPIFDCWMSPASFGFRVGLGPRRAVEAAVRLASDPRVTTVIEADLSGFFPSIGHNLVVGRVEPRIPDRRMLEFLVGLLRRAPFGAPAATVGLNVGGASSPLLANLVADAVDRFLERHPAVVWFVRYVDDLFIGIAGDTNLGEQVRRELVDFLVGMGLSLSSKKTFVRSVHEPSQCLGHDIFRTLDGNVVVHPSESRIQRLDRLVETELTNQEVPDQEIRIRNTLEKVRGWKNFYQPHHLAESIANAILGEAIERLGMMPIDPRNIPGIPITHGTHPIPTETTGTPMGNRPEGFFLRRRGGADSRSDPGRLELSVSPNAQPSECRRREMNSNQDLHETIIDGNAVVQGQDQPDPDCDENLSSALERLSSLGTEELTHHLGVVAADYIRTVEALSDIEAKLASEQATRQEAIAAKKDSALSAADPDQSWRVLVRRDALVKELTKTVSELGLVKARLERRRQRLDLAYRALDRALSVRPAPAAAAQPSNGSHQ